MSEDTMIVVFIPALVTLLTKAENLANRPLSKDEVLRIHDKATVVTQPLSLMPELLKKRGYDDLYAREAWEEW